MGIGKYLPALLGPAGIIDILRKDKLKDALSDAEEERGITATKGSSIRDRIGALGRTGAEGTGMKRGGPVKKPSRKASGGKVSGGGKGSASKRADGIAKKGKTRGKIV